MPASAKDPYGEFRFLVGFDDGPGRGQPSEIVGGFSDVTGLGGGTDPVNYRNGDDAVKHVRKISGTRKFGTVTLRRGPELRIPERVSPEDAGDVLEDDQRPRRAFRTLQPLSPRSPSAPPPRRGA